MALEKDKYIGYIEMSVGIGDMVGPALAGVLYDMGGFKGTFLLFGIIIFFGILFCIYEIPHSINTIVNENSSSSSESSGGSEEASLIEDQ